MLKKEAQDVLKSWRALYRAKEIVYPLSPAYPLSEDPGGSVDRDDAGVLDDGNNSKRGDKMTYYCPKCNDLVKTSIKPFVEEGL